ncbi:MAG: MBL fold metallo-hydrolase [Gammaproteobacteria bacterium]
MTKIRYMGHAGLIIETDNTRIAFDPWFASPAYCGNWHIFPKPVEPERFQEVEHLVISHGHEDHFHADTLKMLPKQAECWVPYGWYGGMVDMLIELGFEHVHEVPTFKRKRLGPDTWMTFVSNNLDTIIVIESGERVIVNVNDALHAAHSSIIDMFVNAIRHRWPRIDTVLCGFGGASYFPNMVHAPGKDDRQVGTLREQLFAHNFCRIVEGLAPRQAIPFAADFALLDDDRRWIAETRFARESLPGYFSEHFPKSSAEIVVMYPGDVLRDDDLLAESPYRAELGENGLEHLLEQQYAEQIGAKRQASMTSNGTGDVLAEQLSSVLTERAALFGEDSLSRIRMCIQVPDLPELNCFNISFEGSRPIIERSGEPASTCNIRLEANSAVLLSGFEHEWGGEAITIGYGAHIEVMDSADLPLKLDNLAIDLITRLPSASRHIKKEPVRGVRYMLSNPLSMKWALKRAMGAGKQEINPFDQNIWLTRSKCDICRLCDLPLLDDGALGPDLIPAEVSQAAPASRSSSRPKQSYQRRAVRAI